MATKKAQSPSATSGLQLPQKSSQNPASSWVGTGEGTDQRVRSTTRARAWKGARYSFWQPSSLKTKASGFIAPSAARVSSFPPGWRHQLNHINVKNRHPHHHHPDVELSYVYRGKSWTSVSTSMALCKHTQGEELALLKSDQSQDHVKLVAWPRQKRPEDHDAPCVSSHPVLT